MKRSIAAILTTLLLIPLSLYALTVDAPHFNSVAGPDCSNCHSTHMTLGSTGYNNVCLSCHRPGDPGAGGKPITFADAANPFGTYSTSGINGQYRTSHRWDGSDTVPAAGAKPPLQSAMTSSSLRDRSGGQLACVRCHNQHSNANGSFLRVANNRDQLCLDCHRSRNVSSHLQGSHPVSVNYSSSAAAKPGLYNKKPVNANSANPTSDLGSRLISTGNTLLCSTCHGVHYTDSRSSTVDGKDNFANLSSGDGFILRTDRRGVKVAASQQDKINLCTNCHTGKKNHNGKGQDVQCNDCHSAHVDFDPNDPTGSKGINTYLIRRNVSKDGVPGSIFFRYTGSQREYKNDQSTGVCQGCHAVPDPGTGGAPPQHASNDPKVCNTCHEHSNATSSFSATGGSCNTCHGNPPSTGGHTRHADTGAGYLSLDCIKCHGVHKDLSHANGSVSWDLTVLGGMYKTPVGSYSQVGATGAKAPSAAYGQCNNIYCHSSVQNTATGTLTGVTYSQPTWGGTPLTCGSCHADMSATAGSGSHVKHAVTYGIVCTSCHSGMGHDAVTHADGKINLAFTGTAVNSVYSKGSAFAPGAGYGSCSTNTCHSGNGSVANVPAATWGSTLNCFGCHNVPASNTGSHAKHLAKSGITCEDCHYSSANGSSAIKTGSTTHVNSGVNVGGGIVTTYQATAGIKNCTTICHNGSSPIWGNPGSGIVCGTCHSVGTPFTTNFNQFNADDQALHNVHFGGNNVAYGPNITIGTTGSGCATCHAFTDVFSANHDNQVINLDTSKVNITVGSATLAKGNSGITAKCSTCHTQAAVWKSSASSGGSRLACESCHSTSAGALSVIGGKTAPDKTSAAATGHGKSGITKGCTACHDSSSSHIGTGGTKRLLGNYSSSAAGAGCNNCHDSSVVSSTDKKNMKVHRLSGLGSKCSDCHNVHGTANSMMVNGTINGTAVSYSGTSTFTNGSQTGVCQTCHTSTQYFTKAGTAPKTHVDSSTNCLGCHKHNPDSGLGFIAGGACDSCHGYPPAPRVTKDAISFGIQGSWPSARFEDYSGGGGAHLVAAHIAKNANPSEGWANCIPCHSGGAATHTRALPMRQHIENVKVSVDPQYRFNSNSFIVYSGARFVSGGGNKSGSCFNVSCHIKPSPKWSTER